MLRLVLKIRLHNIFKASYKWENFRMLPFNLEWQVRILFIPVAKWQGYNDKINTCFCLCFDCRQIAAYASLRSALLLLHHFSTEDDRTDWHLTRTYLHNCTPIYYDGIDVITKWSSFVPYTGCIEADCRCSWIQRRAYRLQLAFIACDRCKMKTGTEFQKNISISPFIRFSSFPLRASRRIWIMEAFKLCHSVFTEAQVRELCANKKYAEPKQ